MILLEDGGLYGYRGEKCLCQVTSTLDGKFCYHLFNEANEQKFKTYSIATSDGYAMTEGDITPWHDKPVVDWEAMPAWANAVFLRSNGLWKWSAEVPKYDERMGWVWENCSGHIPKEYAPKYDGPPEDSLVVRPGKINDEEQWHEQDTFTSEQALQLVGREVRLRDGSVVMVKKYFERYSTMSGSSISALVIDLGMAVFANEDYAADNDGDFRDIVAYKGEKL